MKNAMKKLMSLMLVAVLLVGMIPFAASAVEDDKVSFAVKIGDSNEAAFTKEGTISKETTTVGNLLKYWYGSADASATYSVGGDAGSYKNLTLADLDGITVTPGQHVVVRIKTGTPPTTTPTTTPPTNEEETNTQTPTGSSAVKLQIRVGESDAIVFDRERELANGESTTVDNLLNYWAVNNGFDVSKYTFEHYYSSANGKIGYNVNDTIFAGDIITVRMTKKVVATEPTETKPADKVVDEEWMKDIYLYIYTNNDLIQPSKRVLLNSYSIVNDHKLSKAEILSVVDDYYKASNANNGIIWKGAYVETSNITALDFVAGRDDTNGGSSYIDNLDVARSSQNVIIKVRVTGVTTVGTTYTADSSNPKTGDSIYTAMTVMGISAAALASVMYFYNKKRMAL